MEKLAELLRKVEKLKILLAAVKIEVAIENQKIINKSNQNRQPVVELPSTPRVHFIRNNLYFIT